MESPNTKNINFTNATIKGSLVLPLINNTGGKVLIQTVSGSTEHLYNSYIITSSNGEIVVLDPFIMPSKDVININPAAIASSHNHFDHVDPEFTDSYPDCKKVLYSIDDITTKDFHIYTILSSHNGDVIQKDWENYFIVVEVDGLRIAHLGDLGQTHITDEQMEKLGKIDIAFTQFENDYSDMSINNEKGFRLIEQLNPKIIIPTHYWDSITLMKQKYGKITEFDNLLSIAKEDLPKSYLNVYRILNYHKYM